MCWLHALQKDDKQLQRLEINAYWQLSFSSHHSLQQKLRIIRTLLSRAENIIKEDELKRDEIHTINNTLITNVYPRFHRKRQPARSESKSQQTKIMTVVPYEQKLTESIKSVLQQVDVGDWRWL